MSTMKFGWGSRIALLYGGFVVLIAGLVTGSMRQDFDLVADNYYQQEIAYQNVLDAGKNQAALSAPVRVYANETAVMIEFPADFTDQLINGDVHFYSPIEASWDKEIKLNNVLSSITIPRSELKNTRYKVKINWTANEKTYYQESEITLQ
ncbi:MAG TPA: FixH family protein [Flavipsychrobacter sp.]